MTASDESQTVHAGALWPRVARAARLKRWEESRARRQPGTGKARPESADDGSVDQQPPLKGLKTVREMSPRGARTVTVDPRRQLPELPADDHGAGTDPGYPHRACDACAGAVSAQRHPTYIAQVRGQPPIGATAAESARRVQNRRLKDGPGRNQQPARRRIRDGPWGRERMCPRNTAETVQVLIGEER